ncbi:MAG: ribonuclease HII [Patescibacteria group bacterium]|nr:ribonuclease HII [Patescibacteria group bacterium]
MDKNYIIGIDEAGKGPIAGPVCVAVFKANKSFLQRMMDEINLPLRDSKKLTKNMKNKWYSYLVDCKNDDRCDFAYSFVSAEMIDKFGISKAIKKALETALSKIGSSKDFIYLDGRLKAPEKYIHQKTIIKGDELHPIISLASIIAKVSRDRVMFNFSKKYPNYRFEKHVGYGTKAHYQAIKSNGLTPIHRKSFIH